MREKCSLITYRPVIFVFFLETIVIGLNRPQKLGFWWILLKMLFFRPKSVDNSRFEENIKNNRMVRCPR